MTRAKFAAGACAGFVFLWACGGGGDGPTPVPGTVVVVAPTSIAFGALGATKQLTATVTTDGVPVAGATVTWSIAGGGTKASVSPAGLVTSLAVGTGDTVIATFAAASGPVTARVPVTVAQVVAAVVVTSAAGASPDTLFTTGRTRQFNAAAQDSNANPVSGVTFTWFSTSGAVASVNGSGLVTALTDGSTQISATGGGKNGTRTMVINRFPATFTLTSPGGTINQGQTLALNGTAQDSIGVNLPIRWVARSTAIAAPNPIIGAASSAYGIGGGTTQIVMQVQFRSDSVAITVNNIGLTSTLSGTVQPIFTANCAVSGCHVAPAPAGTQNLSAGVARASTVGVAAVGFAGATRIIAGDPDNSYLVRKIEGRNINGSPMPEGAAQLTATQIGQIRMWILAGAQNN